MVIDAPLVCAERLVTNDIVEISEAGFRIIGRKDNVICSGGIKIQAEEVERILKPYIREPFLITKRKDEKFGEIVVLLTESNDLEKVKKALPPVSSQILANSRDYVFAEKIPMTETGKPARKKAEELLHGELRMDNGEL